MEIKLNQRIIAKLAQLNQQKNTIQMEINKMISTVLDFNDVDYQDKIIRLNEDNSSIIIEDK